MMEIKKSKTSKPLLIFFFTVVAIIESVWILKSDGFYYIDELSHYLYSRFVLQALPLTIQTWHRPIPQWIFALPAQFGHTFTMFFAAALFICLLYIAYRIALLHGIKHAEWVVLLVGLQPILFDLSYACMTEMPTAFMIALSYYYHLKKNHGVSLALASGVILCRSEMYIFAGLMFLVYAYKREWKILPLVLIGPLLLIGSTTVISGSVLTFFTEWKRFTAIGKFIPGVSLTHYVENLQTTFGYAQAILFGVGALLIWRAKKTSEFGIIYAAIAMTIVFHTIAGAEMFHWTGSIGELRYITVIGPLFGIVSLYGMSEILERIKIPAWQFIFSLVIFGVVVLNCTEKVHPRLWANYNRIVIALTKEMRNEYPELTILSNNPIVAYVLDVSPAGGKQYAFFNKITLKEHPECLILWDAFSSNSIFYQTEVTKEMLLQDTTVTILEKTNYWSAEYLILLKHESSKVDQ
jgi:hypothetical protein